MDPGYTCFHEPARSWSCLYEPPRSYFNSTDLPVCSPTHVIQELWTSPLVSSHDNIIIRTSPLILSRVQHQPWTYLLMTQSSISWSKSHITTYHMQSRKAHYFYHYCLVLPKRRQATFLRRPPSGILSSLGTRHIPESMFHGYRLAGHYLPPGAPHSRDLYNPFIAQRLFPCRQALYQ